MIHRTVFFSEYIDTIIRTQSKDTGASERYRCCTLHEGLCGDAALSYRTCQVDTIDVVFGKFCTDSPEGMRNDLEYY